MVIPLGTLVQYTVAGTVVFGGFLEYRTADGWVGIRQPHAGNRLDEVPAHLITIDPT